MRNKFLSLFIAAVTALLLTGGQAFADEETDYGEAYRVLSGLSMLGESMRGVNYDPQGTMTRGEFSTLLATMLYPDIVGTQTEIAFALVDDRIFADVNELNLSDTVTYAEAVKMAAVAAGYELYAEQHGGWPGGYLTAASDAGITKGVSGRTNDPITNENIIKLLYNMLNAEVMEPVIYAGEVRYELTGRDVLEKYRKILYREGKMTANGMTALDMPEYFNPSEIIVDSETYLTAGNNYEEYLGERVLVYYTESTAEEKQALFVTRSDKKTETVTIDADMIYEVSERVDELHYFKTEDAQSTTRLKLSASMQTIYNGKAVAGYTAEDFMPDEGEIVFIDYDGDGVYDTAKITSYETLIADSIDTNNFIVYNRLMYDGAISQLELDENSNEYKFIITKNGAEAGFEDIAVGNILSVAQSKSSDNNIIRVLVSDMSVEDRLTSYDYDDEEIEVSEKVYKLASSYFKANLAGLQWGAELTAGNNYIFLIDAFGKVAAAKYVRSDSEYYAYLFSSYSHEDDETFFEFKVLTQDGEWVRKRLAKNVRLDGESVKADKCFEYFRGIEGTVQQLLRIKDDSSGNIREIRTATQTDEASDILFTKGGQRNNRWFAANRSMQGEVYAADGAVFFNIPAANADESIKRNENYYSVISPQQQFYDYVPYDMDEFYCAKAFTILNNATGTKGDNFLVQTVSVSLNSDEIPVTQITGSYGSFETVSFMGMDENALAGVEQGDFITLYLNASGAVTGYDALYKVSQGNNYSSETHQSNWGAEEQWDTGRIDAIDHEKGFMRVSIAEGKDYAIRLGGSVTIFDVKNKRFENGLISDLKTGDFLVFRMSYYNLSRTIAYRF